MKLSEVDVEVAGGALKRDLLTSAVYNMPSVLGWDSTTCPVAIYRIGRTAKALVDLRRLINQAVWAAPLATQIFHVDSVNGVDTNTGIGTYVGDFTLAVKTLTKAVALANATGIASQIIIKPGSKFNRTGAYSAGTATYPTVHCAIIGWNGTFTIEAVNALTWTQDGTYPAVYTTTQATVGTVLDNLGALVPYPSAAVANPIMVKPQLTKVADKATCAATAMSWYQNGTEVGVRYTTGVPPVTSSVPTLSNISPILGNTYAYGIGSNASSTKDLYFSNVVFDGGVNINTAAATRNVVFENCTARFAGYVSGYRGFTVDNMTGVAAFRNCRADLNGTDGLNFHTTTGRLYHLTIDCAGWGNGVSGQTSCNGLTGHEYAVGIDVNGDYRYNQGGTVAFINLSRLWCVRTYAAFDAGDPGGGGYKTSYRAADSAIIVLDDAIAEPTLSGDTALLTSGSGQILTRNHVIVRGVNDTSGSTLSPQSSSIAALVN